MLDDIGDAIGSLFDGGSTGSSGSGRNGWLAAIGSWFGSFFDSATPSGRKRVRDSRGRRVPLGMTPLYVRVVAGAHTAFGPDWRDLVVRARPGRLTDRDGVDYDATQLGRWPGPEARPALPPGLGSGTLLHWRLEGATLAVLVPSALVAKLQKHVGF